MLAAALTAVGCDEPATRAVGPPRPNILILSVDTLRSDHVSTYGYERKTTPRLDALARLGVVFERAYSHSPKTAPSHMSLMTSLLPEAHGVRQLSHPDSRALASGVPTLAELLRQAGYRTAAITAGGNVSGELGFDRGMHSFQVVHDVELLMRSAGVQLQAMQGVETEHEPLFLFLHTYEVHDPYMPKVPFREMWSDPSYAGRIPASLEAPTAQSGDALFEQSHRYFWDRVDRDDARDVQRLRDLYDGSIRHVDNEFAKLLGWLRAKEMLAETLIVVLSDHGEEFGDHGGFLHTRLYREQLHVPLVIVFPAADRGRTAGSRISTPVRLIDVAPTLLDYLQVGAPEHMQGRSLLPLIEGREDPADRPILSSYAREGRIAIQQGEWKLVVEGGSPARGGGELRELYDLATDPAEQRNVALGHAAQVDALSRQALELDRRARDFYESLEPGPPTRPDADTTSELRALGYLE
jgi:choline-sulfatase